MRGNCMRPSPWIVAAFLSAFSPAQLTELRGTIVHGDQRYEFAWDGKEVVVTCAGREVARQPAATPPHTAWWTANPVKIAGEDGETLATVTGLGTANVHLQVHARRARAVLDIGVEPPSDALAAHLAVEPDEVLVVTSVAEGGPAARAGVQRHDVIVAIDGERGVDREKLRAALSAKKPGDELALTLLRRGAEREVRVRLGSGAQTHETWIDPYGSVTDLYSYLVDGSEPTHLTKTR